MEKQGEEGNQDERMGTQSMESAVVLCHSLFPRWYVFPLNTMSWEGSKLLLDQWVTNLLIKQSVKAFKLHFYQGF